MQSVCRAKNRDELLRTTTNSTAILQRKPRQAVGRLVDPTDTCVDLRNIA